jgi:membrane-associated PAP2 superfamily phosphatase
MIARLGGHCWPSGHAIGGVLLDIVCVVNRSDRDVAAMTVAPRAAKLLPKGWPESCPGRVI